MIGGAVVLALGVLLMLTARSVAGGLNDMRAEKARRSSFYSAPARERLEAMYKSRGNQELQTGIVRAVGGVLAVGGIGILIHAVTN
jgi:hypothetical protein